MRILLDTHVLLWWLADDDRLGSPAIEAIEDGGNTAFVSAASIWEIEIKRAKGALSAPDDLIAQIESAGLDPLPITAVHAQAAARLPRHHQDPFDRMLVAQAVAEEATLITSDEVVLRYEVSVLSPA